MITKRKTAKKVATMHTPRNDQTLGRFCIEIAARWSACARPGTADLDALPVNSLRAAAGVRFAK